MQIFGLPTVTDYIFLMFSAKVIIEEFRCRFVVAEKAFRHACRPFVAIMLLLEVILQVNVMYLLHVVKYVVYSRRIVMPFDYLFISVHIIPHFQLTSEFLPSRNKDTYIVLLKIRYIRLQINVCIRVA